MIQRETRLLVDALPEAGGPLVLDAPATHHLLTVLRAREGQTLLLLDGRGQTAEARLAACGRQARLNCQAPGRAAPATPLLEAWLPVIRPERMEWAVEKLTELGVRSILPYTSRRTGNLKRPPDLARLERIARAGVEQSGNPWIPTICSVRPLDELLESDTPLALAHPSASRAPAPEIVAGSGRWALLAGPEGGFHEEENDLALKRSSLVAGLGPHVVRAETALVSLAGILRTLSTTDRQS